MANSVGTAKIIHALVIKNSEVRHNPKPILGTFRFILIHNIQGVLFFYFHSVSHERDRVDKSVTK